MIKFIGVLLIGLAMAYYMSQDVRDWFDETKKD